jgi:chromosome segregation ATPase
MLYLLISDMSTASNGSGRSKSSTKQKFSTLVKDLLTAAKSVIGHEKDIEGLDQYLEEKRELEGKLRSKAAEALAKDRVIATKDQEIARLQSRNNTLFEEFQKKYKDWDTGTTKQEELGSEVAQLQLKLKQATKTADSSRGEVAVLKDELAEHQDSLGNAVEKLKSLRGDLASKERELTGALRQLERLHDERVALGVEDLNREDLFANQSLIERQLF